MSGEGELDQSLEKRLEALLDSFAERYAKGEHPSISDYAERQPELAEKIREAFPALFLLEKIRGSGAENPGDQPAAKGPTARAAEESARLGEYRLIREVGRGGMGVVYEAEQESLGRHVALKVLPLHARTDAMRLERFRREAQAAALLQHPNIVPVYGLGEHEGIHFYSMQFVDGQSLDRVIPELRRITSGVDSPRTSREDDDTSGSNPSTLIALGLLGGGFAAGQSPIAVARAARPRILHESGGAASCPAGYYVAVARVAAQAAQAIAYAHGKKILHRDIKPSNLIVDVEGKPWVADFGLAKLLDDGELTKTGEILGTLRYMAPEQFRGCSDHRSDIYSLGLTVYELVTLRPAFEAEDREQLSRKATAESPIAPRRTGARVPHPLERIVLKAIQSDPDARYQSAEEMAEDLERFLGGKRIRARLPGPVYPLRAFVRRHRVATGLVALVLGLGLLAAGALLLAHRPQNAQFVIARDLDGDGRVDLLSVNAGSRSISLASGDGKGAFSIARHFEVGEAPISAAAADLDGDGNLDLAVPNHRSSDVCVLRNRGDGSFLTAALVGIGARVNYLAGGDLDGDRRSDLIVAAVNASLHVLRNQGQFRFEALEPFVSDQVPNINVPVLADLDGDGDLDVAASCQLTTILLVLPNRGDGVLEDATSYDLGQAAWGLQASDLDGDGVPDLVVTHTTHASLSLLRNDGTGSFAAPGRLSLTSPVQWVACGDLNRDGLVDLAAAGSESYACVLLGLGGGEFGPPSDLAAGKAPSVIELADLDGDGNLDLVVSNYISSDLSLFFNDGRGGFARTSTLDLAPWWRPRFLSRR